jgi:tetratricopeptide (TPR) repeat protein
VTVASADRPLTNLLAGLCRRVGYWCLELRWYWGGAAAFAGVLRFQPDDTYALFYDGWTLNYLERHGEAIRYFDRLQTLTPSGMADYLKGQSLHAESRHAEAIVAFQSAISRGGENEVLADVYNWMGHSLAILTRHLEAKEAFEQAAFLDPTCTYSWESMGTALAYLGRWKEAVPCLERAMRLKPTRHSRCHWSGRCSSRTAMKMPRPSREMRHIATHIQRGSSRCSLPC